MEERIRKRYQFEYDLLLEQMELSTKRKSELKEILGIKDVI